MTKIVAVKSREILVKGNPSIETQVVTENGSIGVNVVTVGSSAGSYEADFIYDGGERYGGKGVLNAIKSINDVIAPSIEGLEATDQQTVDKTIVNLDPAGHKIGANSIISVSGAVVKAAANHLGVPLYRYIGGAEPKTLTLPIPIVHVPVLDAYRESIAGGKPDYAFVCYGFKTVSEAIYAGWQAQYKCMKKLGIGFNVKFLLKKFKAQLFDSGPKQFFPSLLEVISDSVNLGVFYSKPRTFQHSYISDEAILEAMANTITDMGYKNRMSIMVDVAASFYYDSVHKKFVKLFSESDKTREDLIEFYKDIVSTYPISILEDPLNENDFEGHAILTKELGIEVAGDDIFGINVNRLQKGIEMGACNAMILKVNRMKTVSDAIHIAQLAQKNGYKIIPCGSRGEADDIVDYAVGLGAEQVKGGGLGWGERLLNIEKELGNASKFVGINGVIQK